MLRLNISCLLLVILALPGNAHGGYYFLNVLNHGQQNANSTCVHGTQKFGTGGSTIFTVPNNCSQLTIKIWGAGGGGGGAGGANGGVGGPGGYMKAVLFVVPGSRFQIRVGEGGLPGTNTTSPAVGRGAAGGGYAGIFSEDGLIPFAVVGGGGGAGGSGAGAGGGTDGGPGGGSSGVSGQAGTGGAGVAGNSIAMTPGTKGANSGICNATVAGAAGVVWNSGLTISSPIGGAGSSCQSTNTSAVASWGGGEKTYSTSLINCSGGGGGSGYYGGGGGGAVGGASGASGNCGGGGGGGGYAALTVLVQQLSASALGTTSPPNASDTDRTTYSTGVAGNGGAAGTVGPVSNATAGEDALVVIQY